jgi:hypothetical protein
MPGEVHVAPGEVLIAVYQADDGVGVFSGGMEILHVDFAKSRQTSFGLSRGQSRELRFEVYNITGGNYRADIIVNAANRRVYEARPSGWTGWFTNIAWQDDFTLIADQ